MAISFISEHQIDEVVRALSKNEHTYEDALVDMQGNQPILFSYFISESFKLLTKEEKDYLMYLSLVIWQAVHNQHPKLPLIESEKIEEIEEQNWTLFNETKVKGFREKLDVFFAEYLQEDLLAFVEDALVENDEEEEEEEEDFLTKEGKELIFIGLRTEIDALCGIVE